MPGEYDYYIVGGGPAGSAAASVLATSGFRVALFEALPSTGLKPCGRAIPDVGDLERVGILIPRECITGSLAGAELFVDGIHTASVRGLHGFIIDRECFTRVLLESAGVRVFTRAPVDSRVWSVRVGGDVVKLPLERVINALGNYYYSGEKINAIQYIFNNIRINNINDNIIYIYFDTELLGYYWIFPAPNNQVEIGVGGYASFTELRLKLEKFIKEQGINADPVRREGARIAVGGLQFQREPLAVGEAAGFVLPLTGEGIRPSILSAATAAQTIVRRGDPLEAMDKLPIAGGIRVQRRILEKMKALSPRERREILMAIPEDLHVKVALGYVTKTDLIKAALKNPRVLLKLVR